MAKDVYIVHCIDTEGPLYESIEASFSRLKEIFGIDMEPTKENLRKIQNQEVDLGGKEALVADAFADKRISTLGTWSEIDNVLDDIMTDKFRNSVLDSDGNGWVFNWFCVDHTGFTGKNPRRRDAGYGNIYEHYYSKLRETKSMDKDLLQFHYHPLPFNGHYNYCGTSYVNSNNIFEIIAHRIIDNNMFPASYRAGMEAERPDSHWFLEQWIPFDYSNDSYIKNNFDRQPDLRDGRYGDWRHASMNWTPYHPSHDDYQKEGNCNRWITRCLSLDSRVVKLEVDDVRQAFKQAESGKDAIIAFANHDFRDMHNEVKNAMNMIEQVSKEYPNVKFHYANAIDAMAKVEGLEADYPEFSYTLVKDKLNDACEIKINAKNVIFGSQPFLAIKTVTGQYLWDNLDYGFETGNWTYVLDDKTLNYSVVENIAFASNNKAGDTELMILNLKTNRNKHLFMHGHNVVKQEENEL